MPLKILQVLLLVSAVSASCVALMGQSCRPLDHRVEYRYDPGHMFYRQSAVVLGVSRENNHLSVLISVPSQQGNHSRTDFLRTTDGGRTWRRAQEFPSSLALPSISPAAAPSNANIQYKFQGSQEVYLRSEDGGKSWRTPANKIGEIPPNLIPGEGRDANINASFSLAAIHPKNPFHLYATIKLFPKSSGSSATSSPIDVGLFVSRDGAENWQRLADNVPYATPVGIDPSNPSIMFTESVAGVVMTTDGGLTWNPVGEQKRLSELPLIRLSGEGPALKDTPLVPLKVTQIAVDPKSSRAIYLVTNKGVYRSQDEGGDWCLLNVGSDILDSTNSLAFDPENPAAIFVGTRIGVFQSDNGGESFKRIYPSMP
jgi:photosystem II stability/assembly factor-like uncharacterized protein